MKITVVTVCLNAQETIEATMLSVLGQTFQDIEYLIIDGKSSDETLDIVNKYIYDKRMRVVSEKDSGLYSAMNKAIGLCTGDYIIFMNSGDVFYDDKVIEDMLPHLQVGQDLVYGNVIRKTLKGDVLETYHGRYKLMALLLMGRMMSHQTLFTKTEVMRRYMFDESYKICADYDFIVRAKKDKRSMAYIDKTVCVMDNTVGISSQVSNMEQMRREDDRSLKKNFSFFFYILFIPKTIYRYIYDVLLRRT